MRLNKEATTEPIFREEIVKFAIVVGVDTRSYRVTLLGTLSTAISLGNAPAGQAPGPAGPIT